MLRAHLFGGTGPGAGEAASGRGGRQGAHAAASGAGDAGGLVDLLSIRRLAEARDALERLFILRALARAAGSRTRAARELGISRQGLWQKLRRHGIG